VVKNKIAPPFRTAEFDIMYNSGISFTGDLLDLSAKYNLVRKAGAFYSYKDTKLGQGRENSKIFLQNNPELFKSIEEDVKAFVAKKREEMLSQGKVAATENAEGAEKEEEAVE
jgi:recombination protein RecA